MVNIEKLKEIIHFHNPWWLRGKVPEELLADYERPILEVLLSYLDLERILVIKGPRRTGKTTLLYQMIFHLIRNGIDPESILFLSLEDLQTREDLDEIVKVYQQLTKKVLNRRKKVYFFLDEVQFLSNWSFYLKKYFDKKYPIQFIVSGSAASLIKKDSESLAGRTLEEVILPFSFYEYLDYHLRDKKLKKIIDGLREEFNFRRLPSKNNLIPYEIQIKIIFEDYLNRGGFPHLLKIKEKILWQKLLKEDVIEKVIYRDLIELYQIKKPFVLERLFLYLTEHSSDILNISNIANSLGLSREYTERYIDYLKNAYLIFKLQRYSKAFETQMRKAEKCYVLDPGLMQLSLGFNVGKVVETAAASHLLGKSLYYWRNNKYEVDIVLKIEKYVIPLEIKYKNEIKISDLKGVLKFLDDFKQGLAVVVTKDLLEERKLRNRMVLCLPAWLFLLMV